MHLAGGIPSVINPHRKYQPMEHLEKKEILSDKIKEVIGKMLDCDEMPVTNISVHIAEHLQLNYSYLSDVFSGVNGDTIEHYIIKKRIEKARHLLASTRMEIGKIAKCLNYKSCTHFSAQFRAITGLRPSFFRKMAREKNMSVVQNTSTASLPQLA